MRKYIALMGLFACSNGPNQTPDAGMEAGAPVVELRADTNRNGTIDWDDPTEGMNKDKWDAKHGAIFLANIDDDTSMCPKSGTDVALPLCNDAADTDVNGDADALDLAPLGTRPWPNAPAGTTGTFSINDAAAGFVHLFKKNADGTWTFYDPSGDTVSADEIKAGIQLGIEATDIVRDRTVWDGLAHVTFTAAGKSDTVVLRVAPVITRHHLEKENRVYVTTLPDPGSTAFRDSLKAGMTGVLGSLATGFYNEVSTDDQWTQDFFELGYMSMPIAGGKQHVIDVFYRSSNVYAPNSMTNPLRPAGKVVFTKFRGPDAAGVQAFDIKHDQNSDSLNSFGNLETIPPYSMGATNYPLGRVIRGNIKSFGPDPVFETMIESQGQQPPVYVDTSWLFVGHIDETVSFLKAPGPRGWVMLANDARMAKQMLDDQVTAGNGNVVMFEGMKWSDNSPAQVTISQLLADQAVMKASMDAAAHVDSQIAAIKMETGLDDTEIIHVPFLHEDVMGFSLAHQPGTVNSLVFADNGFASPDPHGPVINGKDIFKQQLEDALGKINVKVAWIEDWDLYHALAGEVHCGSNSRRDVPDAEHWWESGY
jgi:protein-arginine deiminase